MGRAVGIIEHRQPDVGWRPLSGSPLVIALAGDATITASAAAASAMSSRLNAHTPC